MSTLVTIQSSDQITNSRADINSNFSALNTDKIETSYLDTDSSLSNNSDTKIPSQKAVKAYVDTGGNVNASETTKGIVEEATDAEVTAGTATGGTGAKLFVTPAKLATRVTAFTFFGVMKGGSIGHDNSTTGAVTTAHGLGKIPKFIKVSGVTVNNAGNISLMTSSGVYDGTTNSYLYSYAPEGGGTATNDLVGGGTGYILLFGGDGTESKAVATFDATNITLTWSKSGSPTGTSYLIWEAIA